MQSANLCRLAVVEKSEILGLQVRNRVPCRVRYNHVDAEETLPHNTIGGAQGCKGLLRNGRISQRRGLPDYPASPENHQARQNGRALRVGLIHHDSKCPKTCGEHSTEREPEPKASRRDSTKVAAW